MDWRAKADSEHRLNAGAGSYPVGQKMRLGQSPGKIRGPGPQKVPAALLLYSETLNTVLWSMAQSLWLQNRTRSTYNEHSLQTSFLILASDLAIPLSIGLLVE